MAGGTGGRETDEASMKDSSRRIVSMRVSIAKHGLIWSDRRERVVQLMMVYTFFLHSHPELREKSKIRMREKREKEYI